MPVGNFSRKVLKPKIFSLGENNFYTMLCFSIIKAYLVLILYYFFIYVFSNIYFP